MDDFIAYFNMLPYDRKKGREAVNREFGKGAFVRTVKPLITPGVMAIFDQFPVPESQLFVTTIADSVRKRIARKAQNG